MKDIQVDVFISSIALVSFSNDHTGEVREMTQINYLLKQENDSNFVGYAPLVSYAKGDCFKVLSERIMKPVKAVISQKLSKNGAKFVIMKIDNIDVK